LQFNSPTRVICLPKFLLLFTYLSSSIL
jgi:hypothetical protein